MAIPDGWGGLLARTLAAALAGQRLDRGGSEAPVLGIERPLGSTVQHLGEFIVRAVGSAAFDPPEGAGELNTGDAVSFTERAEVAMVVSGSLGREPRLSVWPAIRRCRAAMLPMWRDPRIEAWPELEWISEAERQLAIVAKFTLSGRYAASLVHVEPIAPIAAAPPAPVLVATGVDHGVRLDWSLVAGATSYEYAPPGGMWMGVPGADGGTSSYVVPSLTPGTAYTFRVRAVGSGGRAGAVSNAATATPTGEPAAVLTDATAGNAQVELAWTWGGTEANIGGWEVSNDGGSTWATIAGSSPSTRMHTVTGLTNGTTYRFRVRPTASDPGLMIPPSNQLAARPGMAPTLTVEAGDSQATLRWGWTGGMVDRWEYQVDGGAWRILMTTGEGGVNDPNDWLRTFTGLTNGTVYRYRIRAVLPGNAPSAPSLERSVTPQHRPVVSASDGVGMIEVTWTWGGADPDSWEYRIGTGGAWTPVPGSSGSTRSATISTGLELGENTIFIRAIDNGALVGLISSGATAENRMAPAMGCRATASASDGTGSIDVTWTWPSGCANPAKWGWSSDRIARPPPNFGEPWPIAGSTGATRSYTLTSSDLLMRAGRHRITVSPLNADNTRAPDGASNVVTVIVTADEAPVLTATPGDGFVDLAWTWPWTPQAAAGAVWEVSSDGGSTWADVAMSAIGTRSTRVTGLTNGTAYNFAVRAKTAGAVASNTTAATPAMPMTPVIPPAMMEGLVLTPFARWNIASMANGVITWGSPRVQLLGSPAGVYTRQSILTDVQIAFTTTAAPPGTVAIVWEAVVGGAVTARGALPVVPGGFGDFDAIGEISYYQCAINTEARFTWRFTADRDSTVDTKYGTGAFYFLRPRTYTNSGSFSTAGGAQMNLSWAGVPASAGQRPVIAASADRTLTLAELGSLVVVSGSAAVTLSLPDAPPRGASYVVANTSSAAVTVDGEGTDTVDGAATANVAAGATVEVLAATGSSWVTIG